MTFGVWRNAHIGGTARAEIVARLKSWKTIFMKIVDFFLPGGPVGTLPLVLFVDVVVAVVVVVVVVVVLVVEVVVDVVGGVVGRFVVVVIS